MKGANIPNTFTCPATLIMPVLEAEPLVTKEPLLWVPMYQSYWHVTALLDHFRKQDDQRFLVMFAGINWLHERSTLIDPPYNCNLYHLIWILSLQGILQIFLAGKAVCVDDFATMQGPWILKKMTVEQVMDAWLPLIHISFTSKIKAVHWGQHSSAHTQML